MKRPATRPGATRRASLLVLAMAGLIPMACGSSGTAPVSGKVTHKGQPVPSGTITFIPKAPGGRNATGQIKADGSYTLQTENPGDGAAPGDYAVTVYAREDKVLDYIPKTPVPPKFLVPEKYEKHETSGLKATVKAGSNSIPIEVPE